VKRLVKLRDDKAFRSQEKSVVIVGEALVRDVAAHLPLKTLISAQPFSLSAQESYIGSPDVLKKIITLETEDLVAAEVALPPPNSLEKKKKIIVLDALADPGNVGTILRTALGLGWDGAFLTPHTADPFNDKALRAARGAPLFLPLRQGSWAELEQLVRSNNMAVYVADIGGKNLSSAVFKAPLALILGHETKGPSPAAKKIGQPVSIPMTDKMESLNVASAAAILMYQIQQNEKS
jgi:TrmH family RNA methyltransferase